MVFGPTARGIPMGKVPRGPGGTRGRSPEVLVGNPGRRDAREMVGFSWT